ncbi:polyketide synthase dehydratase domain-containing protein, partial [Streptomyces sp. MMG1121]|uniref:polyketide synthase dehydratase domain-containing protein n=1 Tax=Streptomyces sp. MMG1121 TaxID=1415544 RepID=UPI000B211E2F
MRLPDEEPAGEFGLHPALLEAALHTMAVQGADDSAGGPRPYNQVRIPFSWAGLHLFASGASALRVRIEPTGAGTDAVA